MAPRADVVGTKHKRKHAIVDRMAPGRWRGNAEGLSLARGTVPVLGGATLTFSDAAALGRETQRWHNGGTREKSGPVMLACRENN